MLLVPVYPMVGKLFEIFMEGGFYCWHSGTKIFPSKIIINRLLSTQKTQKCGKQYEFKGF
jgi:hypothetical protein